MNSIDNLEKRTSNAADVLLNAMESYKKALEDFTESINDINKNNKKRKKYTSFG